MSRKVVHCTSVHSPFDVRIFHKECKTLAAAGYEVVLVAPHQIDEVIDGIRLMAIPKPASRWARFSVTLVQAYRACAKEGAEVYHFHDPELMPVALMLRVLGKRVVYDIHEDLPRQVLSKPWIPKYLRRSVAAAARFAEGAIRHWMTAFVAATPAISRRFPGDRTVVVQNFPLLDEFPGVGNAPQYAQRHPWVVYAGGLTRIRGVREMVRAMELVSYPAVKLKLAGTFDSPELEREVRSLRGWERVDFLGWVQRTAMVKLLTRARIGLVLFHPVPNHFEARPTKLFEYMAAGLPVIASNFPLWRQIVDDTGCGLVVNPLEPEAIARAIDHLCANPDEAQRMGERGRKAVEQRYNWDVEGAELLRMYRRLLA